uniref:Putative cleavage/polyadenylation specificity factor, A subunit n=1 Tax=Helianthus annuus TaxID=4232 RepID=A0A251U821_HELAN
MENRLNFCTKPKLTVFRLRYASFRDDCLLESGRFFGFMIWVKDDCFESVRISCSRIQSTQFIRTVIEFMSETFKRFSFHYCKYRRDENQLYVFADDSVPRWLTSAYHVDFDSMAGADKFGNIYFVRLPQDVSDEIEDDPTGGKIKWEHQRRLKRLCNFMSVMWWHVCRKHL